MQRPIGITVIAIIYALSALVTLTKNFNAGFGQLSLMLLPTFLLGNVLVPIGEFASAVGIWNRKQWGWLLIGVFAISSLLIGVVKLMWLGWVKTPLHMLPELWKLAFPGVIAAYLFQSRLIQAFGWELSEIRQKQRNAIAMGLGLGVVQVLLLFSVIGQINESL